MDRMKVVRAVEERHCPNSTDGSGTASNHIVGADYYCGICDRHFLTLAHMHGIETDANG